MVLYELKELKTKGITELKKIAKELGVDAKGFTKDDKDDLARKISRSAANKGGGSSKSRRRSPRKASRRRSEKTEEPKAAAGDDLSKMTVVQLKAFAKKSGISLSGKSALKKAELRAYIENELAGGGAPPPAPAAGKAPPRRAAGKAAGEDLSKMTVAQLKAFAKQSGISLVGKSALKKAELRAYIEEELGEKSGGGMPPPTPPKPRKKAPKVEVEEEEEIPVPPVYEEEEEIPVPPVYEEEEEETVPMPTPIFEEEEEETVPMPTPIFEEEEIFVEPEESERDKLKKLKISELKKKLLEEGIIAPSGLSKDEIIDEFFYGERCDPENDEMCPGDKYCDVRPLPGHKGICISPTRKSKGLAEFIYKGKKIVGSSEAIASLREKLEPKPAPKPAKPSAAEISPEDIEDVLREVREEQHEANLDEIGEQVLKCLGVLSS